MDGPPILNDAEIATIKTGSRTGQRGLTQKSRWQPPPCRVPREDGQSLNDEVARVFRQSCIRCHSENGILDTLIGALRLNSYDDILAGGVRIVVIPGPAEIDGAAFAVTKETRIDDRPSVGQQAEVRARIALYGSLVAERLRDR